MLRIQLLLAVLILAVLLALGAASLALLLAALGIATWMAITSAAAYAGLRLVAPFRLHEGKPVPPDALARLLSLLQIAAVAHVALPAGLLDSDLPGLLHATPASMAIPLLLAVTSELALATCLHVLAPTVRMALSADLAIEQWFAQRRVEVEQQLLAAMSRDSAVDARFRRRLERLSRRLDRCAAASGQATAA